MKRSVRLLAVAVALMSLVLGVASPVTVAMAQGPECDGLEAYVAALESWGAEMGQAMPQSSDSDLDEWTSEQFTTASEAMAAAQEVLQEIVAPDIATEYHTLLIQQIGALSQMFGTMATTGIFGALIYAEQLDATDTQMEAISDEIEAACGIALDDELDDEMGGDDAAATPVSGAIEIDIDTDDDLDDDGGALPGGVGTRENPIPVGQTVAIDDDWELTILSVTPDATDSIMAGSSFNDPPATGYQFFIANVRVTYTGDDSDSFYGWGLRTVGQSAVSYDQFEDGCGTIPDELSTRELFTGGTIEGNLCWSVATVDADSLVLYDSDQSSRERVFFSLMPVAATGAPVATPTLVGQ